MKLLISFSFFATMATMAQAAFVTPSQGRAATLVQPAHPGWGVNDWSNGNVPPTVFTEPVTMAKKSVVADMNSVRQKGMPRIESILEPDFFLTYVIAMVGPAVSALYQEPDGSTAILGVAGNCFHLLLAALLWVQTSRVRCVFEQDGVQFYNVKGAGLDLAKGARLVQKPGNFVVGTENRWMYDKITGYEFFPSILFPVICILKETETGEGKQFYGSAQPHFFPLLFNAKDFKAEMDKRGVKYGLYPQKSNPRVSSPTV